jgi:AraC-like DNA-binding protein
LGRKEKVFVQRVSKTEIHSQNIIAYIEYLKSTGLTVTLHGGYINNSKFVEYNYHRNPYCHYVKNVYGKWRECVCNQTKVLEAAQNGPFFGCCYAGVGEYVYPVYVRDEIKCFVSVSGYRSDLTEEKSCHFAAKYSLPEDEIKRLTGKYLKRDVPEKTFVDAVIVPLTCMLETYFLKQGEDINQESQLYHKVLRFITDNCHSRITMKQLSERFNYSVSTLSHLFLKNSGKSLPEFIDDLRLNEAKWYLANSDTTITEMALFLGYSSGNHFSSSFKMKYGMTPTEYRKKSQHLK